MRECIIKQITHTVHNSNPGIEIGIEYFDYEYSMHSAINLYSRTIFLFLCCARDWHYNLHICNLVPGVKKVMLRLLILLIANIWKVIQFVK